VKEIVVVSGKGGSGKTSLAASLAVLAGPVVVADCDVDAADLHLVMNPVIEKRENFFGGKKAAIATEKCSGCGKCLEICRFGAVLKDGGGQYRIDAAGCEGCGVCSFFCPEKAIDFKLTVNGQWFVSRTPYGPMVHARLGVAEENSGKLVSVVRKEAGAIAGREKIPYIIVDGPPGIGCPVIASVTGADAVLIVTEPTVTGEHDMERVAGLAGYFKVPIFLCINKFDINPGMSRKMCQKAEAAGIPVAGTVAYDRAVTGAQIKGQPVVLDDRSAAAKDIRRVWVNLEAGLKQLEGKEGRR
jgi:MinD superfamily P-loop ATPase